MESKTSTPESRREFEEWANNGYFLARQDHFPDLYRAIQTQRAWEAWQAARERQKPISDEAIESACDVLDDNISSCDGGESDQQAWLLEARDYLWSFHFSNHPPTSEKI